MLGIIFGILLAVMILKMAGLAMYSWIAVGVVFAVFVFSFICQLLSDAMNN